MTTMNLVTNPWIPVIMTDGRPDAASLESVFMNAHKIRDLALRPHERISVMRLLLCVAQAALEGPANRADWQRYHDRISPAAIDYLRQWEEHFALDRFLQVDIKPVKVDSDDNWLSKLDCSLATGHNHALFDHGAAPIRSFDLATLALNLLTFQAFSVGGTIGVGLWNGKPTQGWKAYPKPANGHSEHAPCVAGGMLHAFLVGSTLLETIHLNLLNKEVIQEALGENRWGRPVWEYMPAGPSDSAAIENSTRTYLGRLVPISRAIRLNTDGMVLANGLAYPAYKDGFREPCATIVLKLEKKVEMRTTLWADLNRATWRQLHALTVRRISQNGVSGPLALNNLDGDERFDLWAGGLVTDQSKIIDTLESSFPNVPAALLSESGQRIYQDGVQYAEKASIRLWAAIQEYRESLGDKLSRPENKTRRNLMETQTSISFWTDVEQALTLLLSLVKDPSALRVKVDYSVTQWGKSVIHAMRRAYEVACPRDTSRQIRAYVAGLKQLTQSNQSEDKKTKIR
jgi:CRISPR system Cascade subunit CasA